MKERVGDGKLIIISITVSGISITVTIRYYRVYEFWFPRPNVDVVKYSTYCSFLCVCVPGTYKLDVKLGGIPVLYGPFLVKSYDVSRVRVFGLTDGVVNKTTTFTGLSS